MQSYDDYLVKEAPVGASGAPPQGFYENFVNKHTKQAIEGAQLDLEKRVLEGGVGHSHLIPVGGFNIGSSINDRPMEHGWVMETQFPDSLVRDQMEQVMFNGDVLKTIGTPDVTSLLVSGMSGRYELIVYRNTPAASLCENAGGARYTTVDYVWRGPTNTMVTQKAPRVNLEADLTNQAEFQTDRDQTENTVGFYGFPISQSFISDAQLQAQQQIDALRRDSDAAMIAIKKAINTDIYFGQQQRSFKPTKVPAFGGLLERSLNVKSMSGNDWAGTDIEGGANTIGALIGDNVMKLVLSTTSQMENIRMQEVDRHNGSFRSDYEEWEKRLIAEYGAIGVMIDRVFETSFMGPVAFVHDRDLDQGTGNNYGFMVTVEDGFVPKIVHFLFGGVPGPWSWVRPRFNLNKCVYIANGVSLDTYGANKGTTQVWTGVK